MNDYQLQPLLLVPFAVAVELLLAELMLKFTAVEVPPVALALLLVPTTTTVLFVLLPVAGAFFGLSA